MAKVHPNSYNTSQQCKGFIAPVCYMSRLFPISVQFHLPWGSQDLANLEYSIDFAGAREKRPEGVKFSHDAANCPLVYG